MNTFNKTTNLHDTKITVIKHVTSIDRVSVWVPLKVYNSVLNCMKKASSKVQTYKLKNNTFIHNCYIKRGVIEIAKYSKQKKFFLVNACQPSKNVQMFIRNVLSRHIQKPPHIYQLEIALDLFTRNRKDMLLLRNFIERGITIKQCKPFSSYPIQVFYGSKERPGITTYYARGNIRRGNRGLRVYEKTINKKECLRFEIQLNEGFHKNKGLNIQSLPFSPKIEDVFNHIEYRENKIQDNLNKLLCCFQNGSIEKRERTLQSFLRVHSRLCSSLGYLFENNIPIFVLYNEIRKLLKRNKKVHKFSINTFFPKSDKGERLIEGIKQGIISIKD